MNAWFWYRLFKRGKPAAYWEKFGTERGYDTQSDHSPSFCEKPVERAFAQSIDELMVLRGVVRAMREGDRLGVPLLGMFGSLAVWDEIGIMLSPKKCEVHDLDADRVFNAANPADWLVGADVLTRQVNKIKVAPAQRGLLISTKPRGAKLKLTGTKYENARLLWAVADDMSAQDIATKFGIGIATLYRRMTDNGRRDGNPVGRDVAKLLHKQGKWL